MDRDGLGTHAKQLSIGEHKSTLMSESVGMHAPDQTAINGSIPTSSKNRRYSRRPRPLCDGSQSINTVRHGDDDALGVDILPGTHSARSVDEGANGRVPLPPRVREYTLDYN